MKSDNPHTPQKLTWQVISQTEEVVWSVSKITPPWTWWPQLSPDFCQLAAGLETWDIPEGDPRHLLENDPKRKHPRWMGTKYGCGAGKDRCGLAEEDFYVCPREGRSRAVAKRCGGLESYYCAEWGCETTGQAYWNPSSSWDLITVRRNYSKPTGYCLPSTRQWLPLNITITERGKSPTSRERWLHGSTWGFRWYMHGTDHGVTFKIQLKIKSAEGSPVGPNQVLPDQGPPQPKSRPQGALDPTPFPGTPVPPNMTLKALPPTGQRLLNLVQGAFQVLNESQPALTKDCWLCLASGPPYYEGIAVPGTFNNTTSHEACSWHDKNRLTLTEVSGQGTCLGNSPATYKHLCNETLRSPKTSDTRYLYPGIDKWWACSTGLTPCVATNVFDDTKDYCVLI